MSASSNGAKTGIFGILKGLFRKSDRVAEAADTPPFVAASVPPLAPPPVEVAPVPAAAPTAFPQSRNGGHGATSSVASIAIPLQSILNGFPAELRPKVRVQAVGDLTVTVTLDKILPQLAQGLVHLPFGQIRQAAPHVFAPGIESDRIPVPLPLNEILARVNPALLVRRSTQRQVEVPTDIASPFDSLGENSSVSVGNTKPVQPAVPRRAAPAPKVPVRGSISSVAPPPSNPAGASAATSIPDSIPFPFAKKPAPTAPDRPVTAFTSKTQVAPSIPMSPGFIPSQAAPAPKPVAKPAPATPSIPLTATLSALSEGWPAAIQQEIGQKNLADSQVSLPADAVEAGLKRGRVSFPWKTVRSWIRPATPPSVSEHDGVEVDLPLKVIAPLFIARKQPGAQQKLAVDAEIPNLFFGFPQPEAPAAAPVAPMAAPTPASLPPVSPAPIPAAGSGAIAAPATTPAAAKPPIPVARKPVETNYYIWDDMSETAQMHVEALKRSGPSGTEFLKRYASPNEIVSRAVALDGVAGALIALPDGLMVASRIPTELNADTLAAFLPQLFNKVSQCTKELRMGELNNLNFTVGNVPWKIFRVNAIFFAVFGRVAQALPTAQLAALAAELDRKNK